MIEDISLKISEIILETSKENKILLAFREDFTDFLLAR